MKRPFSLCFAVAATLSPAYAKPKPKPAVQQLRPNLDVPQAGSGAELLDAATGKGRAVGELRGGLADFQATLLPQGQVLITGGSPADGATQWYDPATRVFSPGPPMAQPRQGHRALLLKDGRLLVLGGTEGRAPAEVLEPGGSRFQPLPGDARFTLSTDAVELDNGKVFLVDGASGQCFIWDGRKSVSAAATLNRPRNFFRVTRLKDGRVLISGGWPSETRIKGRPGRPAVSADTPLPLETFNPRWSSLSLWKARPQTRARHQATLLADGRVCLWAGYGQDPGSACESVEMLDPVKETITLAGSLPLESRGMPAWADGLFLPEQSLGLRQVQDPLALLAAPVLKGRLANGYLAPTLVPLKEGNTLVLGTPTWGEAVDRWEPRARQCTVLGCLRPGVQSLGLADGKVLAIGPIVDLVDPRTGVLKPLGWREDLEGLLKTVQASKAPTAQPPFPKGRARKDYLLIPLDKTHTLVAGGIPEGSDEPCGNLDLWDQQKKTLTPAGTMKLRRAFPPQSEGRGGLKLPDAAVLIWGPGKA